MSDLSVSPPIYDRLVSLCVETIEDDDAREAVALLRKVDQHAIRMIVMGVQFLGLCEHGAQFSENIQAIMLEQSPESAEKWSAMEEAESAADSEDDEQDQLRRIVNDHAEAGYWLGIAMGVRLTELVTLAGGAR